MTRPQPRYKPGDRIGGRYQVHQVKMGGMGEVYLCLDLATIQPYALKTFQHRYLANPKLRKAFENEVAIWVALEKHPNIVRCFYMDILDNQPFMILEWIAGEEGKEADLRSRLRRGPLDLRTALSYTIDICWGLIHAQEKQPGLVHRDLKPENVLVTEDGLAKITDFGLTQIVKIAGLEVEGEGTGSDGRQSFLGKDGIVGTPAYMAPEQWRDEILDVRTDIYALGCMLYEMVTNRLPFQEIRLHSLRRQHLEENVPKLGNGQTWLNNLDSLLSFCLVKRREERFATVADLLLNLKEHYEQQFQELPRVVAKSGKFTIDEHINRGVTYSLVERYDKALADFSLAIQLDPLSSRAYNNRGSTYAKLERHEEALVDYGRAIQLDPTYAKCYANRGNVYDSLKRYEEALADYNQAIELGLRVAEVFSNRGSTYTVLQRYKEALTDLDQAIRLDPNHARAHNNRGFTYYCLGRYEEALRDYDRAIQLDPSDALAYMNAGAMLVNQGELRKALGYYEQAAQFGAHQGELYAKEVRQVLAQERLPQETLVQQALRAFVETSSPADIRNAIFEFPFMVEANFIALVEQIIVQHFPVDQHRYFEGRLAWLRKIAQEQNQ